MALALVRDLGLHVLETLTPTGFLIKTIHGLLQIESPRKGGWASGEARSCSSQGPGFGSSFLLSFHERPFSFSQQLPHSLPIAVRSNWDWVLLHSRVAEERQCRPQLLIEEAGIMSGLKHLGFCPNPEPVTLARRGSS